MQVSGTLDRYLIYGTRIVGCQQNLEVTGAVQTTSASEAMRSDENKFFASYWSASIKILDLFSKRRIQSASGNLHAGGPCGARGRQRRRS